MNWAFNDIREQGERWLRIALHRANYVHSSYVEMLEAEIKRLMKSHEETMSEHPGCVYCMEPGTPVRAGEVCSECGDRNPTDGERAHWKCSAPTEERRITVTDDLLNAILAHQHGKAWRKVYSQTYENAMRNDLRVVIEVALATESPPRESKP